MKFLLFGSHGQVGAALCSHMEKNDEVVSYTHSELDVTNEHALTNVIKDSHADVVINATAMHLLSSCEKDPDRAFLMNSVVVRNMALASRNIGASFVTFSTDYVFDGQKTAPYDETDDPRPLSVYGVSKYAGELMAAWYDHSYIIRTAGVFGGKEGSREKGGNFILTILKQTEGKKTLKVSSDQTISMTYAEDLAGAVLEIIRKKSQFGIYNITNSGITTWSEVAEAVMKESERMCTIIPVKREGKWQGTDRPLHSALSTKKIHELGIILPPWQNAIMRYIKSLSV